MNDHPLDKLAITAIDYKHVEVALIGSDGNIFCIMGKVTRALRKGGATHKECELFCKQVTDSESYHAALSVVMDWVTVTGKCAACDHDH